MAELHPDIQALRDRWRTFLAKIEATFDETVAGVEPELLGLVAPAKDGGLSAYLNAWTAMKGQLMGLTGKIDRTWDGQVKPKMWEAAYRIADETGEDPYDLVDEVAQSTLGSDASERIIDRLDRIAIEMDGKAALRVLEIAEASASRTLRCKECDADLEIDGDLYVARYVACVFCGRRNTYEPSTDLREVAWFAMDHVARYRALGEWDALQAQHQRYSKARHPTPPGILTARAAAFRAYHERVLKERIRIRPDLEKTFDRDLQAILDTLIND